MQTWFPLILELPTDLIYAKVTNIESIEMEHAKSLEKGEHITTPTVQHIKFLQRSSQSAPRHDVQILRYLSDGRFDFIKQVRT